jgi:hypothetical protein
MDLHNLNIRLLEYKQIAWTCIATHDPEEIHAELMSARVASGITHDVALVMSNSLWIPWWKNPKLLRSFKQCNVSDYNSRGVIGVWASMHSTDEVVVMTDVNVNKDDRTISTMSFAFLHISQVKYPRQYDAPARRIT